MNKNRRLYILIFSIIVLASVFFMSSCGEAKYIYLPNIDESISKKEITTETAIEFSVSYAALYDNTPPDPVNNKPGLVLTYLVFDNTDTSDTNIVNPPMNTFETGSYYSVRSNFSSQVSHGILSVSSDHSILNTTISSVNKTYPLKSFKRSDGSRAVAPQFHLAVESDLDCILQLENKSLSDCSFSLISAKDGSRLGTYLLSETFNSNSIVSIVIFASGTSGDGNYNSSTLFSLLTYVGTININFND